MQVGSSNDSSTRGAEPEGFVSPPNTDEGSGVRQSDSSGNVAADGEGNPVIAEDDELIKYRVPDLNLQCNSTG